MLTTAAWAESLGISPELDLPPVPGYSEPYARSAHEIAVRTVILQGVVAVAFKVDPEPIVEWLQDQSMWQYVTEKERSFIENRNATQNERNRFSWHQEAEWTLLWMINKVKTLGLATTQCDTRRLVDEIIPPLGSDIQQFLSTSVLRPPGSLLIEDDRTYNLWCYAHQARRKQEPLPEDLNLSVLYERRYAFEWLDGNQEWDDVTCDA
jgi:hypothetical protein